MGELRKWMVAGSRETMHGPNAMHDSGLRSFSWGWLTLALFACSDASSGVIADVGDADTEVSAPEVVDVAGSGADTRDDDDAPDDGAPEVQHDSGNGGDSEDAHDADEEVGHTADVDGEGDATVEVDTTEPLPAVLTCPVGSMDTLYVGALPPNPYGAWPAAPDCVKGYHDVIIVLGCPSNDNGSPANCQTGRVDIAMRLQAAGYGDRFIVSGGAVHNQWVEAEALRALLLSRGVANDRIWLEPQAEHTDENIYFSTQIMKAQGWRSALVVSNDPGHLMMTALCDSNCCVELGRLTLFAMPVTGGLFPNDNVGHYVLIPPAQPSTDAECTTIQGPIKFMCTNLASRRACKDDFKL